MSSLPDFYFTDDRTLSIYFLKFSTEKKQKLPLTLCFLGRVAENFSQARLLAHGALLQ